MFKATKVWGDRVLSTNRDLDYTLFTVENFAQVQKFGYLTSTPRARPAATRSTSRSTPAATPA